MKNNTLMSRASVIAWLAFSAAAVSLSGTAFAAAQKTYQVTGPVLDVTDSTITVQKGKEKWEISRDAATEAKGEVKKGDKVTIEYKMSAVAIKSK
jgi:cytochrome c1